MNRSQRMGLARQTVEIVERGSYTSAGGRVINIAALVRACLDATRFYAPEELERLRQETLSGPSERLDTAIEVARSRSAHSGSEPAIRLHQQHLHPWCRTR